MSEFLSAGDVESCSVKEKEQTRRSCSKQFSNNLLSLLKGKKFSTKTYCSHTDELCGLLMREEKVP